MIDLSRTRKEKKGYSFEKQVAREIGQSSYLLYTKHLFTVYNKYLEKYSETDLLVCDGTTVWVLECKSVSHCIQGSVYSRYWYMYTGYNKYNVFSPYIQCREHGRCIRRNMAYRGIDPFQYEWRNLVVVPDGCEVKADPRLVVTVSKLKNILVRDCRYSPGSLSLFREYTGG